ncbi:cell wall-binding repeat-containing protein [Kineococcus sp. DHX-1]|uniref:cell wall-binding repeat-containing protein n=1 Tax=Kineococcus sp. DHX-1 TaxID=3349638 RepID=UPI0036D21889
MTAATSRLRRRGIGAGVAALVGLSGLGFAAMPAQAAAGFDPAASQVSGVDRFDTAARIATAAFPGGSQTVVVANGDRAIDAQAGAYAAGLNNAPILLTQKSSVPTYTVNAIKTLGATKAIVLGDSNSVDATALAQMTAAGLQVQVVSGADRFATAAAIYNLGSTKSSTVFLARADLLAGQVSADALAASPLSFDGTPVLLTNASSLPSATANAITSGGVKNVVVLGNAITDSVKNAVTALGATVTTIAGDDRSLTAQKIAEYGVQQGKYQSTTATIANGDKIDALAAGPWAALNKAPILLTLGTNSLGTGTTNYLTANASTLNKAVVFGDANSVPAGLTTAAKTAGGGNVTSNQTITVAPTGNTSISSKSYSASDSTSYVEYTATVPAGVSAVSIRLVDPSFPVGTTGVTFPKQSGFNLADFSTATDDLGATRIVSYNGIDGVQTSPLNSVPVVNGKVTFRVGATGANTTGTAVPLVYAAANSAGALQVDSTGAPVSAFGLGGQVTLVPGEAAAAASYTVAVTSVGNGSFTGNTGGGAAALFNFQSGDTYTGSTYSDFVNKLSVGDTVTVSNYTQAAAAGTRNVAFALTADKVAAPTGVSAALRDTNFDNVPDSLRLSYTAATSGLPTAAVSGSAAAQYRVATVTNGTQGTWGNWTDATPSYSGTAGTIDITPPATGTYVYQVRTLGTVGAVYSDASASSASLAVGNVSGSLSAAPSAPVAVSSSFQEGSSADNTVNNGDTLTFTFNEPLSAPAANASVTLTDGNTSNTVGSLTNGVNATFTRTGTNNNVLSIAVTGAPAISAAGTNAGIQYPNTVSNVSGVTDTNSTPQAWAPSSAVGVNTIPSSSAVVPSALAAGGITATTATNIVSGAAGNAIPGATVTVVVATGTATGAGSSAGNGTYSVTAAADGSWSVTTAGNIVTGNALTITQRVQGIDASAASAKNAVS